MISRLAFLLAAAWLIPVPVDAACLFGGGLAGQSPAYQYAVSFIHGVTAADTGLTRISTVSKPLRPTKDHLKAHVDFTDTLKQYELAARDFECAASSIESQQNFSARASNSYAQEQTELARLTATTARGLYLQLAKDIRLIASSLVAKMKGSITDAELAYRMVKSAANLDDIPRTLFSVTSAVPHILVDPQPDSSDRMSRLRITASERSDLIKMLDSGFGERIAKKGDRPAMEAAAALLREWLTTSGHIPAPE